MGPMSFRPGAQLAARPLHVVFLLDCSGSMATDGKIDALNRAVRETLPALQDLVAQNPFVDVRVRVLTFSDGARWHLPDPTPVASVSWPPVVAGGFTDLGAALRLLAPALERLHNVVKVLKANQANIDKAIPRLASFTRIFANNLGNGRWFDTIVQNLTSPTGFGPGGTP